MKRLSHGDLYLLIAAIQELNSDVETNSLPERALSAASKIIEADSVAFTGFSFSGEYEGLVWQNSDEISPEELEIFTEHYQENPLMNAFIIERRPETLKITDLMPAKDFQQTNVYNEFYKRVGVTNQLVAPMTISEDFFMSCSINTIREDFSERDKLILTLIAPHFANAIRNSFAYQRLSAALDAGKSGVIAVNAKGKSLFISEYARRLLEKYFAGEKRNAGRLPESLVGWLKQIESAAKATDYKSPPAPLKIENQKGVLTIRFMYNSGTREKTLMLEEQKSLSLESLKRFSLTTRETEILFWLTQGKTDDVIAALLNISLRTVHKHVQNIYTKLGVETRVAAIMKTLDVL